MSRYLLAGVVFTLSSVLLLTSPLTAQKPKKPDKVPEGQGGVKWEYRVVDDKGKLVEEGAFKAIDSKIYQGTKQVGTYQDVARGKCKVDITKGELKGHAELRLIAAEPPTWNGELERGSGARYKMTVIFRKELPKN